MPTWWGGKKSTKTTKEDHHQDHHTNSNSNSNSNSNYNSSIKNDNKRSKYKPRSFDELSAKLFSPNSNSPRTSREFSSANASSGFSGFDSDRGHPLPRPSLSSGIDQVVGLGSGYVSVSSSVSSSGSSEDQNHVDHHHLCAYRGSGDYKMNTSTQVTQPRSPGPGSRVGTAATSPLHPRFTCAGNGSVDSPTRNTHPLPLPPGSPTSPSSMHSPRTPSSGLTEISHGILSKWKKGRLLGRGTFGNVYLGFNSESGQMCAIKEVRVVGDDPSARECLKQLNQEITLLSQLWHPNIVQYYGSELSEETLSVYLEYVSGGSIHKLLQEYGPFREPVMQNYTRQILSGLAYLHGRNTVHRDIKGANILVDPNGEVKLADFGMAKHITACTSMLSFKGSPYWMAPEVVMNTNGYTLAVDIWSLGCTILEMATSKPPWGQYEGVAAIFKIGNSKDIPEIPDHLSHDAKCFIKLCLQRDPSARPTALKLLDHPFVRDQATTRVANVSLTKEAFPRTFDGNRTPSAMELNPNRSNNMSSFDGGYATKSGCTTSRNLVSPRNNTRTITSLPVSPSSSPLRQHGSAYKSCFLSPPHPSYAMMGQNGYNLNDYLAIPGRPNTKITLDPWYDIPQFKSQTPPNRSPRRGLL